MRAKQGIAIAAAVAVVLIGVALLRHAEPVKTVYQGRPLTYWMKSYPMLNCPENGRPDPTLTVWQQPDAAVLHAGTNAIPVLLAMLRANDFDFKNRWKRMASEESVGKIPYTEAFVLHQRAAQGFYALGATASNAVPALIQIYRESTPDLQVLILAIFGFIGPPAREAVPILLEAVTNRTQPYFGIHVLGKIHAEPELVVPVLIQLLHEDGHPGDERIRESAVQALGAYGTNARAAVPLLVSMLEDPISDADSMPPSYGAKAVNRLSDYLRANPGEFVPLPAEAGVSGSEPVAPPAAPRNPSRLVPYQAIQHEFPEVKQAARKALQQIDPEAAAKAGIK